jgi:hypothetical protein
MWLGSWLVTPLLAVTLAHVFACSGMRPEENIAEFAIGLRMYR